MPGSRPPVSSHTVDVEEGFLPHPAIKLVITQYLEFGDDPPFWAWIIVGVFYDRHDRVIWSTEVFIAHLDIQLESDGEQSSSGLEAEGHVSDSDSCKSLYAAIMTLRHLLMRLRAAVSRVTGGSDKKVFSLPLLTPS